MKKLIGMGLLTGGLLLSGVAFAEDTSDRARMKDEPQSAETQKLLRDATEVYRAFAKGSESEVPQNVLNKAECVAVFPNTVTAAVVVGGTHGDGIASCKGTDGKWSQPAFVDLNGGSIGAQVGGKSTDVVLFLMDKPTRTSLREGTFTLGADVSVVAGKFERAYETEAKGVVAYTRNEGAFAGAAINGVSITKDEETTREYYGKDVSYPSLIDGTAKVAKTDDGFVTLLPR
jgi:SH3 domain-containing YSC84-like protein 1